MRVAFYDNAQDVSPRVEDLDWPSLAKTLTTFRQSNGCTERPCLNKRCPGKNGAGWSPVDIHTRRANDNVQAVTAAVFDLDHIRFEQLAVLDEIEASGHAFALHTTHGHQPPENYSLRLVMPLSRPVLPHEWAQVRAAAVESLKLPAVDPHTKDLSRFYYLPDAPKGGGEPVAESKDGRPLDVDALLKVPARPAPAAPVVVSEPAPVNMHDLADALLAHAKHENKALIRSALRGDPLPMGQQDSLVLKLMGSCAFILPLSTPVEAIIQLFRPCFSATDWRGPDGRGSFDTEHLIGVAVEKLQRRRRDREKRDAKRAEQTQLFKEKLRGKIRERKSEPEDAPDEKHDASEDWASTMILKDGRRFGELQGDERPTFKVCTSNILAVLRFSPDWSGCIRFDDVAKEIRCIDSPLGVVSSSETLDCAIAEWFAGSEWGAAGLLPKPAQVREVLLYVAQTNTFDPIRDYLESLEWDGTPRAEDFLARYLGATGVAEYLRPVSKRWLVSLVARALRPGCKADTVLVLEGPQGRFKSSAFDALGGAWFTDTPLNVHHPDGRILASKLWVIELSEATILKTATNDELKAFFSSRSDTIRLPYARAHQAFPRRAIFVGTTNAKRYLHRDPTGYRRWWPVRCEKVDIAALRRDRAQILAEAVRLFENGEQWWLTEEEQALADAQAAERSNGAGEAWQDEIRAFFLRKPPDARPKEMRLAQIAVDALELTVAQVNRDIETKLGPLLDELGFGRRVKQDGGVRSRVWVTPKELLEAPQEGVA